MESVREILARLAEVLFVEGDHLVGSASRDDLIRVPAKEHTRPAAPHSEAEEQTEIKARLVQEAWISGGGFLY